ncbi:hypothetical protein ACXYMT_06585 [Salinimicrobium sp. CAU 1759]
MAAGRGGEFPAHPTPRPSRRERSYLIIHSLSFGEGRGEDEVPTSAPEEGNIS